jgi:hypothetical protein
MLAGCHTAPINVGTVRLGGLFAAFDRGDADLQVLVRRRWCLDLNVREKE